MFIALDSPTISLVGQREQLAIALQDLPPEAQRVVYPILRLKMVQNLLFATLKVTHGTVRNGEPLNVCGAILGCGGAFVHGDPKTIPNHVKSQLVLEYRGLLAFEACSSAPALVA